MNNFIDALKDLKSHHLPIELLYCVTGVFLLLVLNYLFEPTSDVYPNWSYFNDTQRTIALIIFAYFLARICNEIGRYASYFITNCLKSRRIENFKFFLKNLKGFLNEETRSLDSVGLSSAEIDDFIHSNGSIAFAFSRRRYSSIIKQIIIGFLLVLTFVYSFYCLILALLLLASSIYDGVSEREDRIEVASFYLKKREKERMERDTK